MTKYFIVRNGSNVGIYVKNEKNDLILYTKVIGRPSHTVCYDKKEKKGYCVNEIHIIPKGYNVRCELDRLILDSCLGLYDCYYIIKAKNPIYHKKEYKKHLLVLKPYSNNYYCENPSYTWWFRDLQFKSICEYDKWYNRITKHTSKK